jgi:hypothetical protein
MAVTPKEIEMKLKLVVLASASRALEYKRKNPSVSDEEILRYITKNTNEIINECY